MKVLGLDPSSTATGYALLDERDTLIECGVMLPRKRKLPAWDRIKDMVQEVRRLIGELAPDHIVIEVPSGQHRRIKSSPKIVTYGVAVGAICTAVFLHPTGLMHLVEANVWTGGKRKADRQAEVAATYPGYDPKQDPGADAADAIGVARWWIGDWRLRQAARQLDKA